MTYWLQQFVDGKWIDHHQCSGSEVVELCEFAMWEAGTIGPWQAVERSEAGDKVLWPPEGHKVGGVPPGPWRYDPDTGTFVRY